MLEKTYRPAEIEAKHYARWEEAGAFAAEPAAHNKRPYTIIMPPPNVTGSLHMGHALTFTLQDVLIRYHRQRGEDALWQPGQDHAGIATQMVVERQLAAEGKTRQELGREAFVERVWAWRGESGGTITRQLRRLGASADWPRDVFTLDPGVSRAVRKVFVALYRKGLIYRDNRLVNWDPKLHTAISDLEVEQKEVKGHLWHIRYPVEGGGHITVATTRPETMLGDTGVAVHPEDERFRDLVGKHAVLPLVGRRIPIVADDYSDPTKGTGAVKITPAHDFNDFEVGRRHGLEAISVLDADARTTDAVPEAYRGLDRYEARKRVVADLEAAGLLEKTEAHTHTVPYGDRSGVVIEPRLTVQWYCDAKTLAEAPIRAVETGATRIVPKQHEATFFEWMRNIQPWCISRQLWWGHQIPAWYGPDGTVFVGEEEAEAAEEARRHYGREVALERDPDVLDTWFSSGLWPFSTLGWPEENAYLKRYYPGDVLVTGLDIIFFWVARMMMFGSFVMGEVPFREVYLHGLVRDERGQKMSKTKGNFVDPLELLDKFGADAVRFTLCALCGPGRDVKVAEARIQGYRNFATKLWNASRYAQMNGASVADTGFRPGAVGETVNRWIVGETAAVAARVGEALGSYRFDDAAQGLYRFLWGSFCDWYLELTKPMLQGPAADETRATMGWVLAQTLRLLHPLMPFITEELWESLGGQGMLIGGPWPELDGSLAAPEASAEMDWVVRLIEQIRAIRAEMNVPPGAQLPFVLVGAAERERRWLGVHGAAIGRLARLGSAEAADAAPAGALSFVHDDATGYLALGDTIDIPAEAKRLARERDKLKAEVVRMDAKLGNQDFIAKADPEVVEETRERRADTAAAIERLEQAIARLQSLL